MSLLKTFFQMIRPQRNDVVTDKESYQDFAHRKYELFQNLSNKEEDIKHEESIIDKTVESSPGHFGHESINSYGRYVYGNISDNKYKRLNFYRAMSSSPEVSDAVDEICDACINYDDEERFIKIRINDDNLDSDQINEILTEFENFASLYDFDNRGWEYFRDLIREGEIVWENIVDSCHPENGILAVNRLPAETFEYLINKKYDIEGILLNSRLLSDSPALAMIDQDSSIREKFGKSSIDVQTLLYRNYSPTISMEDLIPLHINQITLVTSGAYNEDKMISYPILEKARKAYRQLTLLEDATIIYKLVRAPERLLFNVDTGTMPVSRAEQFVEKMKKRFQSKKVYDPMTGGTTNDYDPHQMLENYWFPKPQGSGGTTVSTIGGTANSQFSQLDDLKFFLQKLYRSLKVPFRRFSDFGNGAEVSISEKPTYEEYRFSKFIIRLQKRMALGIQNAFFTHLQLKGIVEKFDMNHRSLQISFNQPANYEIYEKTKLMTTKLELLEKVAKIDSMLSPEYAFKEIFNWTPKEMDNNYESLKKWRLKNAEIKFMASNIEKTGTPNEAPIVDQEEKSEV